MRFRFVLTHDIEGELEISEPDAWKECVLKLERHEEFHSLIEYFDGSFIFYGNNGIVNGGIDFIKLIELNHGPDATLLIDIDLTFDDIVFIPVFNGQFKLTDLEEMPDNKMRLPIIRDDFWATFISRLGTPVNLQNSSNLDDGSANVSEEIILKLSSQTIQAKSIGTFDTFFSYKIFGSYVLETDYLQIGWEIFSIDEITQRFSIPSALNTEMPFEQFNMEYEGEYVFTIRLYFTNASFINSAVPPLFTFTAYTALDPTDMEVLFLVNGSPISDVFTQTNLVTSGGDGYSRYDFSATLQLKKGDLITIVGDTLPGVVSFFPILLGTDLTGIKEPIEEHDDAGTVVPDFPNGYTSDNIISVVGQTIFPESTAPGFLVHDVAAAITDRIIGQNDSFYSELLGSSLTLARQYEIDGCAWTYAAIKGLQLRQYTLDEKPFFQSFNQWWTGINPILNLSLMYDTVNDQQVIRVEDKAYQYDDSITSLYLSNVRNITRKYDNDKLFNKVEIGYSRWESEDISGIDDPQTKKTYSSRFKKIGKGIQIYSEWIAASLLVEQTRRTSREKSADYRYDNETFIIALNPALQEESPDISPDRFHFSPELDENFSSVTNLLNSDTRYNLKLTPARNFLRWQDYLQGGLQSYVGSSFRFSYGEGNYDMTSTMNVNGCLNEDYDGNELGEKEDIPVTTDYLHLAHLYEISYKMEWLEFVDIRNNRRHPIGVSQTDTGHVHMFIKTLEYKPVKGEVTILAWAKEYLDLSRVADTTPMQECYPNANDCADALTDSFGEILTDELGVCITE